jgi:mRNA-degrading endonuclease RelE of RelBE toxin-antitoxin system
MAFEILYSPESVDHLAVLSTFEQTTVVDQVEIQLVHEPNLPTRRRKLLRPNAIAVWELRISALRVFYDIEESPKQVVVVKAIGKKVHNQLWIGNEKIEL